MNALGLASMADSKTRTAETAADAVERKPATTARTIVSAPAEQDQTEYEAIEHIMVKCEDCGGIGIDPGSLNEPEKCESCGGYGDVLAPLEVATIARRTMERAKTAQGDEKGIWSCEERIWRVGE